LATVRKMSFGTTRRGDHAQRRLARHRHQNNTFSGNRIGVLSSARSTAR
jgi:hypothetical protein